MYGFQPKRDICIASTPIASRQGDGEYGELGDDGGDACAVTAAPALDLLLPVSGAGVLGPLGG
jgi:hypothetical protein